MESSINWIGIISLCISTIAISVSILTIWKTQYTRFRPIINVGNCKLSIYPFKSDKEEWFISSLDIPISITNKGAQIGIINGLRIKVSYPEIPIKNNYEIFDSKWIVDGRKISKNRLDWVKQAVVEEWIPILILPKETKTKHIVFETRWNSPVIQKKIICTLEFKSDKKDVWQKVIDWNHYLSKENWVDLTQNGRSYISFPNIKNFNDVKCYPNDLHKYTGIEDDISDVKVDFAPSYLNYKK